MCTQYSHKYFLWSNLPGEALSVCAWWLAGWLECGRQGVSGPLWATTTKYVPETVNHSTSVFMCTFSRRDKVLYESLCDYNPSDFTATSPILSDCCCYVILSVKNNESSDDGWVIVPHCWQQEVAVRTQGWLAGHISHPTPGWGYCALISADSGRCLCDVDSWYLPICVCARLTSLPHSGLATQAITRATKTYTATLDIFTTINIY